MGEAAEDLGERDVQEGSRGCEDIAKLPLLNSRVAISPEVHFEDSQTAGGVMGWS